MQYVGFGNHLPTAIVKKPTPSPKKPKKHATYVLGQVGVAHKGPVAPGEGAQERLLAHVHGADVHG